MAAAVAAVGTKVASSSLSQLFVSSHAYHQRRTSAAFAGCSSHSGSPFTERYSFKPLRGGGKIELICDVRPVLSSCREEKHERDQGYLDVKEEHDMAAHLPELRQLLSLLRKDKKKQGNDGSVGNVFLVGTGPGDPDLLTIKALKLMHTADLVLYDRLVSTDILDLVHSGARLLYVGKTAGYHSRTQDEIHQLLLSFAEAGATVLRLKGGDPLVFGRGGEEMEFLQQQGVHVRVVPGITAASGIGAELGIPLTHRGAANSVRFLTGHSRKGGIDPFLIEDQAADPDSTLVVYMGLATLPSLAAKLINSGLPADTPSCAVERGTTAYQRKVFAELQNLPSKVASAKLESPTLIFIGRVVALSPHWPYKAVNQEVTATGSLPPAAV